MTQDLGDHDDVGPGAQQVGGEGVPHVVGGRGGPAGLVHQVGVGGQVGEQVADRPGGQPVGAEIVSPYATWEYS